MSAVLKLAVPPTLGEEIKQDCVRILKKALIMAEAGEVESVLMICKRTDDTWSDEHSGTLKTSEAIGYLEICKQRWISQYLDKP